MGVLLWFLIGLAAGLAMTAILPDLRHREVSGIARRLMAGAAAGAIGAVLTGYALPIASPAARGDALVTGVAALAGALVLSWIVSVVRSRRRPGDDVWGVRAVARDMPAYDAARHALVEHLIDDAAAHERGHFAEVGRAFGAVSAAVPRDDAPEHAKLRDALGFWGAWIAARDRGWHASGPPGDAAANAIATDDWPILARRVASDLALDGELSDERVRARFADVAPAGVSSVTPVPPVLVPADR